MQMIIEARPVDDVQETARIHLAVVDREFTISPLGLSLAEGKALLASAQQYLVRAQCEGIGAAHAHCEICRARLTMNGWAPKADPYGLRPRDGSQPSRSLLPLCRTTSRSIV